jgi:hypothetical protein
MMTREFVKLRESGNLSAARLLPLAQPLLIYVRSNESAIINYGARYRSGRRIATALAESAVNSLVVRRMVIKHSMQWSKTRPPGGSRAWLRLVDRLARSPTAFSTTCAGESPGSR